jgi:PAS domain S-box-containing protein
LDARPGSRRPARYGAVFLSLDPNPMSLHLAAGTADRRVVGTVDEEWRIDRISLEVEAILGYRARQLAGAPLLSAVHPNDLSELLAGLAHIQATRRDAVVRLRVRKADRTWVWCRCRMSALDKSSRFAFTLRPLGDAPRPSVDRTRELEQRLARIAHEVRASGVTIPTPRSPVLSDVAELADLTSREWQVLGRLTDGTRVPTIAGELGLSASTVRNHLSGIFQKLGVRSQAELLERLRPQT